MKLAISSLLFNADSIPSTGEENAMNSLGLDKLPVNFFDVAVVAILVGGLHVCARRTANRYAAAHARPA